MSQWPLPPEDHGYVIIHGVSGILQSHQGKIVMVRLCILDLTQGLSDHVRYSPCQWPLPPEDHGYVIIHGVSGIL